MPTTITLKARNVYGNDTLYPVCPTSQKLCRLAGTKTVTPQALDIYRELGLTVVIL